MAISARDTKALLALIEHAQLVYLLTRYPKKQVLDDPADVRRLEEELTAMRVAAKDLSASLREGHGAVPWDELAKKADDADLAWRKGKRLAPTVLRELVPLLEGVPEAAFFLRPEMPATKPRASARSGAGTSSRPARARSARAARRPGRAGRNT